MPAVRWRDENDEYRMKTTVSMMMTTTATTNFIQNDDTEELDVNYARTVGVMHLRWCLEAQARQQYNANAEKSASEKCIKFPARVKRDRWRERENPTSIKYLS